MPRYSLREFLRCISLVAVGVLVFTIPITYAGKLSGAVFTLCWAVSGAFAGAGVACLYKRPWLGSAIGAVVGFMAMVITLFVFFILFFEAD